MNPDLSYVSVTDPISPAIERVKTVLFRPFDLGKWFVIGFSAWLAQLGSNGGNVRGGGGGSDGSGHEGSFPDALGRFFEQAKDYVVTNLHWILPITIIVAVIVIGVMLLVTWLSSRGRFSFLYCVAQNKGEFWIPWRQYRRHGYSLFVFRVVIGLIMFVMIGVFLVLTGVLVVSAITKFGFGLYTIAGIVMSGLLLFGSIVVFAVIGVFTTDFAVPIMYLHNITCRQAWGVLAGMVGANMGRFVVYVLFKIVISLAIGIIILGTMCATCCIACCLYIIPYIGTVALLPLSVFSRSYSLYYLAQYGPDMNAFPPEPEVVPPTTGMQI